MHLLRFSGKIGTVYARILTKPKSSILLFGARGTGKSTWIRENFRDAVKYDLLDRNEVIRLSKNPDLIYHELKHLEKGTWVIIDEVQKVPELLDEVHRLIENHGLKFILSGSSARKLRRGSANLLAGRAITTEMFPLTASELEFQLDVQKMHTHGMLPMSLLSDEPDGYLRTYVNTYLHEEIKAEALTRSIGDFARFLEIAARQNGQVTNATNIARDAEVGRKTVESYFQILIDTLIGFWLPAWELKKATKQVVHPKFYFFDSGVVRALSGRLPYPPTQEELGFLVETTLLHEIRAYLAYRKKYYPIHYWRSHDGVEVDLLIETQKGFVAFEIKAGKKWSTAYHKGFGRLFDDFGRKNLKCFGIYQGERKARYDPVDVYPVLDFLKALWSDEIIF